MNLCPHHDLALLRPEQGMGRLGRRHPRRPSPRQCPLSSIYAGPTPVRTSHLARGDEAFPIILDDPVTPGRSMGRVVESLLLHMTEW